MKIRPQTPLAYFCKTADCKQYELAKLLGLPLPSVSSYCRGERTLPNLPGLAVLAYKYGVDPRSLVPPVGWKKGDPFHKPRTVTGRAISAEFCRLWEENCGMGEEETAIASKQLNSMLEATLVCLSRKDPSKARLLLGKINRAINDAIKEADLKKDLQKLSEMPNFGKTKKYEFEKGQDWTQIDADCLLRYNKEWLKVIAKFDLEKPLQVSENDRPRLSTPDRRLNELYFDFPKKDQLLWEKFGLGSVCTTVKRLTVTQGDKTETIDIQNGMLQVSSQLMTDTHNEEPTPVPKAAPPKEVRLMPARRKTVPAKGFQPKKSNPARPKKAAPKKLSKGRKSLPLNTSKAKKALPALKRKR